MFNITQNPATQFGYNELTTFWQDFCIADAFGEKAIRDTYKRGLAYAKTNYKYLTELVMVLNHKIWQHYENNNIAISRVYDELWKTCDTLAQETLKDNELTYYYTTLD